MLKILLVAVAALFAGGGAVVNAIWGPRARSRRRLRSGSDRIVDRAIVTLTGEVRLVGDALVAPLSGRACVLFEALGRIQPRGPHGQLEPIVERQMIPFELETPSGLVLVDADTAEHEDRRTPLVPRQIEREVEFLRVHAHDPTRAVGAEFEELVVRAGDRITVQGMALVEVAAESVAERGYRDRATRIRLVAHADHPLTIGRARGTGATPASSGDVA